jgi:hypothetical protein
MYRLMIEKHDRSVIFKEFHTNICNRNLKDAASHSILRCPLLYFLQITQCGRPQILRIFCFKMIFVTFQKAQKGLSFLDGSVHLTSAWTGYVFMLPLVCSRSVRNGVLVAAGIAQIYLRPTLILGHPFDPRTLRSTPLDPRTDPLLRVPYRSPVVVPCL